MKKEQQDLVLLALYEGADNSNHISAMTGLPIPQVSTALTRLCRDGFIERLPHRFDRRFALRGRSTYLYRVRQ